MPTFEDTIPCDRCDEETPIAEALKLYAWWVCGICYDDL